MAQDVAVKQIKTPPLFAPGEGVSEFIRRAPQIVKSGNILFSDTAAINVFELPGNIAVLNAWIHVTTDFDGSGTSAAPSATFSVPVATGAQIIVNVPALSLVTIAGGQATGPLAIVPASGGFGIVDYTPGTTTAGQMEVFMEYVNLADRL